MPITYRIRNWREYQHYQSANNAATGIAWIKLYRRLLDDIEWHSLDGDAAKLLIMLWLVAAERNGTLPSDIKKIAFRTRLSVEHINDNMGKLSHWIETVDNSTLETVYTPPRREESRVEKKREEEKRVESVDNIADIKKLLAEIGRQKDNGNGDHADKVRRQAAELKAMAKEMS